MAKVNTNSKKGFTIIEVVLVLAIAGLIFLMVFVALPALQRSQRDTQRRNDMSRVDTSLVQYQTNHSNLTNNLPDVGSGQGATSAVWSAPTDNTFGEGGCNHNIACEFIRDYMNTGSSENDGKPNNFADPNGTPYSLVITPNWEGGAKLTGAANGTSKLAEGETVDGEVTYTIKESEAGKNAFDAYTIYIIPGGRCIGSGASTSTKRHFAILYRLEGAGTYCIDDQ